MANNSKRMMIFCEPCGHRAIIDDKWGVREDSLVRIPSSNIQSGIPKLDEAGKKAVVRPAHERPKMYKCPKCGRGVRAKELFQPYVKSIDEIGRAEEEKRLKDDHDQRLKDGLPPERKPEDIP